ncbi:MAG: 2-amino-4-hydroxy-6-hydroxymethyldihydropteridine diphosphokinase [Spirochaetes bacterium]|nr:2-amino-4-hydroxy-6-hydroxymethyldihydropteridine diphosphokinase [Spirochaetota bacterium]
MSTAYIGIGSNLGDRGKNLEEALRHLLTLGNIRILAKSSVMETEPVDFTDQPRFLNQVIRVETELPPHDLLNLLKQAETALGREKTFPKGPRTIDLDILLYDNRVINAADLIIPHPEIHNRNFVIKHLLELDPDLHDPVTGRKYTEIASNY